MPTKTANIIKRIVDAVLTVLLLFLMAYQVTGDVLHEWLGIGMTVTLILHHILNRKWYKAVFKGKYSPYRIVMTAVNTLMLVSIALTAVSGMSMSGHAVPFMYGLINVMTARTLHLAMSYLSFILIGVHIGLHIKAMTARMPHKGKLIFKVILTGVSGLGLWLFLKSGIVNYITFRTHFAFLDYTTAKWLIILQNLAMLMFFVLIGYVLSEVTQKNKDSKYSLKPLIWLGCAVIIGSVMFFALKEGSGVTDFDTSGWQTTNNTSQTSSKQTNTAISEASKAEIPTAINDGFTLIEGGSFDMESPDSENWHIADEQLHEVTVSAFYIDPFEALQSDYEALMGSDPSTFDGEGLPVDNISWLDAVQYANARSNAAGLTPVYSIGDGEVVWDREDLGNYLSEANPYIYTDRKSADPAVFAAFSHYYNSLYANDYITVEEAYSFIRKYLYSENLSYYGNFAPIFDDISLEEWTELCGIVADEETE